MMFYHSSHRGDEVSGAMFVAVLIIAVVIYCTIYACVKLLNLVVRAFQKRPAKSKASKALWIALGSIPASVLLVLLTLGNSLLAPIAIVLSCLCILAFFLTAWVIDRYYNNLFLKPPESPISAVLKNPWWDSGDVKAKAA